MYLNKFLISEVLNFLLATIIYLYTVACIHLTTIINIQININTKQHQIL